MFARKGRLAGSSHLGASPGDGRIGGVGDRDEEHRIGFVFPVLNPFLRPVAKRKKLQRSKRWRRRPKIWIKLDFRRAGDGSQVLHGDSATRSLPVRLVARGPLLLAPRQEDDTLFSHLDRRRRAVGMDPRLATGHSP
jgi:hypothetical protein